MKKAYQEVPRSTYGDNMFSLHYYKKRAATVALPSHGRGLLEDGGQGLLRHAVRVVREGALELRVPAAQCWPKLKIKVDDNGYFSAERDLDRQKIDQVPSLSFQTMKKTLS